MDFQLAIAGLRPLTRQIYDQIRSAVLDGRLRRGERELRRETYRSRRPSSLTKR